MIKRYAVVVASLALAACSADRTLAPADAVSLAKGGIAATGAGGDVASPNTPVAATFAVVLPGGVVYRESGPGNNGKGECHTGGLWYNPQNHHTSEQPHDQCATETAGESFTVTFGVTATWVESPSGNRQLNFAPDANDLPRSVHYKVNQDLTIGSGSPLLTTDGAGRIWTLSLTQPLLNGAGNLLVRTGTPVVACSAALPAGLQCWPGTMTW
jgi:hypothetical protein